MATLTASGVICSNGTLDGYYTGTATSNTSYPIGTYLLAATPCGNAVTLNNNCSVNVPSSAGNALVGIGGAYGGGVCAGTWRTRGCGYGNFQQLVQRVA